MHHLQSSCCPEIALDRRFMARLDLQQERMCKGLDDFDLTGKVPVLQTSNPNIQTKQSQVSRIPKNPPFLKVRTTNLSSTRQALAAASISGLIIQVVVGPAAPPALRLRDFGGQAQLEVLTKIFFAANSAANDSKTTEIISGVSGCFGGSPHFCPGFKKGSRRENPPLLGGPTFKKTDRPS